MIIVSTIGEVRKQPVACAEYWQIKRQEGMDRFTERRDINEIMLKGAFKTMQ